MTRCKAPDLSTGWRGCENPPGSKQAWLFWGPQVFYSPVSRVLTTGGYPEAVRQRHGTTYSLMAR